jgi:hypothetical protein
MIRFIITLGFALTIATGIKSAIYAATEPQIEVQDNLSDWEYMPSAECDEDNSKEC